MKKKSFLGLMCVLFLSSGITAQVWIQQVMSPTQINK